MKYGRTFFLAAVLILVSQIAAFGKTYPWSWLPFGLGRILWLVLSIAFLVFVLKESFLSGKKSSGWNGFLNRSEHKILEVLDSKAGFAALIGLNVIFQILNFVKFRSLGYQFPFFCLCACFASFFLIAKDRLLTAFALNIALLIGSIIHFPLTGLRSDMLIVIQQALDLWAGGKDPYYEIQYPWGLSGFPYFPGILFSHLPAWVLGMDLRWNQLFFRAAWMALLYPRVRLGRNRLAGALMIFFALNPFLNFRHDLYFEVFLLLLALWALFGQARFIIIPLLAVTWQFGLALCPFLIWEEIFHSGGQTVGNKIGRAAKLAGGFVIVTGLMVWLLHGTTTLDSFLNRAFFVMQMDAAHGIFNIDYGLTLSPALFWLKVWKQASVITMSGCLVIFINYVLCRQGKPDAFWFCTSSALVFFIMSAIHFWEYFWVFPVFWMILGLLNGDKRVSA